MPPATERIRPTQGQRTDAMRARLLEATLEIIAEEGWANASTQKICKRAGVSRGAQTHHFPTKDSLLIAAVQEIVARYQRDIDTATSRPDGPGQRLEDVFDFLWGACFEGNLLNSWMEVMVASRTDAVLRPAVRETDQTAVTAMRALGDPYGPGAADLVELTVYLLRGMVVQAGVHPDDESRRNLFEVWKKIAC